MRIEADCTKIRENSRAVVEYCAQRGVQVAPVTKSICGEPEIVRAVVAGGAPMIADSRLENIRRFLDAGVDVDVMMLRLPLLSEVDEVVRLCRYSLISEEETARALSAAAERRGVTHEPLVIIETGDRREGIMPEDAAGLCRLVMSLPALRLAGVATSLNCLCGVLPTAENQSAFSDLVVSLEHELGTTFDLVSFGHTGNLHLIMEGELPPRLNHVRIGEGVIFGTDVVNRIPIPAPHVDAFKVFAEVIEVKDKPSAPDGTVTVDAFMRAHEWPDLGVRRRAIVALGEIDVGCEFLKPVQRGVTLVGASSDHLVIDVTDADPPVKLGDEVEFDTEYTAIAYGWSSTCTTKICKAITD